MCICLCIYIYTFAREAADQRRQHSPAAAVRAVVAAPDQGAGGPGQPLRGLALLAGKPPVEKEPAAPAQPSALLLRAVAMLAVARLTARSHSAVRSRRVRAECLAWRRAAGGASACSCGRDARLGRVLARGLAAGMDEAQSLVRRCGGRCVRFD